MALVPYPPHKRTMNSNRKKNAKSTQRPQSGGVAHPQVFQLSNLTAMPLPHPTCGWKGLGPASASWGRTGRTSRTFWAESLPPSFWVPVLSGCDKRSGPLDCLPALPQLLHMGLSARVR